MRFLRYAVGDEAFNDARLFEDSKRAVLRTCEGASRANDLFEHGIKIETGCNPAAHIAELRKTITEEFVLFAEVAHLLQDTFVIVLGLLHDASNRSGRMERTVEGRSADSPKIIARGDMLL